MLHLRVSFRPVGWKHVLIADDIARASGRRSILPLARSRFFACVVKNAFERGGDASKIAPNEGRSVGSAAVR